MLTIRVIPTLLLKKTGLVKTVKFSKPRYIGDPINAVRIFNDKEVDEIIFLDIARTPENQLPDFNFIESIANECFIPFAYGGGVKDITTIKRLYKLGAEKVVINTAAFKNPYLITEAAGLFGSQSVVAAIDVKKNFWGKPEVVIHCGTKRTKQHPLAYAVDMQNAGAGELFVNSVDRDGTRSGYDISLLKDIVKEVDIPVIASGGAGNLTHMKEVVEYAHVNAVAAGSIFVFYGKHDGVLINYPDRKELNNLFTTQ